MNFYCLSAFSQKLLLKFNFSDILLVGLVHLHIILRLVFFYRSLQAPIRDYRVSCYIFPRVRVYPAWILDSGQDHFFLVGKATTHHNRVLKEILHLLFRFTSEIEHIKYSGISSSGFNFSSSSPTISRRTFWRSGFFSLLFKKLFIALSWDSDLFASLVLRTYSALSAISIRFDRKPLLLYVLSNTIALLEWPTCPYVLQTFFQKRLEVFF